MQIEIRNKVLKLIVPVIGSRFYTEWLNEELIDEKMSTRHWRRMFGASLEHIEEGGRSTVIDQGNEAGSPVDLDRNDRQKPRNEGVRGCLTIVIEKGAAMASFPSGFGESKWRL